MYSVLTLNEVLQGEVDDLGALGSDNTAPSDRLLSIFALLLPSKQLNEFLMAEYLIDLELFDLVLNFPLGRVELPQVDADGEPVLLIDHDLSLHDQISAQQDVEQVRT